MKNGISYPDAAALMQHGCVYDEKNEIGVFRAKSISDAGGVIHGFTARTGGVSLPPFDTLNLRLGKNDPEENVRENFRRLCGREGITENSLVIVSFEHGNTVLRVDAKSAGSGYYKAPLPACDGLVTDDPAVTLVTDHADCGCIFVYDPVKRAVGIAHAGWKGTLGRIGGNVVALMVREFGCKTADLIASTGPCICQACYEVDEELAARFAAEFGTDECTTPGKQGKAQLSLETAAAIQLMEAGVPARNITLMEKCTFENPYVFFSHRRDKNGTGDMAGFIKIS